MRCLIYASNDGLAWTREYFPDLDPYLLRIVNKPLLEYFLDLASILKVTDLRIVSDLSIKEIEAYFQDGTKWGVNLSYTLAKPGDSLRSVYLKNISFCKDHEVLLFNGFFFVHYDRQELIKGFQFMHQFCAGAGDERLIYLPQGTKLGEQGKHEEDNSCLRVTEINSVLDYYELSMSILKYRNRDYVLPGYSNQKDTFLGLNVIYPNSSELIPPIMIGNNCSFQKFTIIGPESIIGNNVIIDSNTVVSNSIILDNTYIGPELDIKDKIVYKNHLISAHHGEVITVQDKFLVSQVERGLVLSFFNRIIQKALVVFFILLQVLPWLLLYLPYSIFYPGIRTDFLRNKNFETIKCDNPKTVARTLWGRLMLHMSLDKYRLFWRVLCGNLNLVGNSLLVNNPVNRKIVLDLPVYNPGVFSLAENVAITSRDEQIFYELEFINNVSTRFSLKIVCRSLIQRLLHGSSQQRK